MRIASAVLLLASSVVAQAATWATITPSASSTTPAGRWQHAMTYDTARARTVVFGGNLNQSSDASTNETWEWTGSSWQQRTPVTSPSARRMTAMAFDATRNVAVLYGGYTSVTVPNLADTWEWNGTNWALRTSAVSPPARRSHAMAYDAARQRVVLFGGVGANGALADTWEWDGTVWTLRTPVNAPGARLGHVMAYDGARQRVVLYGGLTAATNGVAQADTWEWDGTNWLARFSLSFPAARHAASLAFDTTRSRCVLFGGQNTNGNDYDETWEWNGVNWTLRQNSGIGVRRMSAAVFDVGQQRVILFGGLQPCCWLTSDLWGFANAAAIEYGVGCGSPALRLVKDPSNRPLIGSNGLATLINAPTPVAGMAMGLSNTTYGPFTLPVPLDSVGMNGCLLWHSAEALGLGVTAITPTSLVFLYPIPNSSSLIGGRVFLQGYCFAPGANPLQIIASNGVEWRLGAF